MFWHFPSRRERVLWALWPDLLSWRQYAHHDTNAGDAYQNVVPGHTFLAVLHGTCHVRPGCLPLELGKVLIRRHDAAGQLCGEHRTQVAVVALARARAQGVRFWAQRDCARPLPGAPQSCCFSDHCMNSVPSTGRPRGKFQVLGMVGNIGTPVDQSMRRKASRVPRVPC